jgi:cellulose biosynthesis protein BcsQ
LQKKEESMDTKFISFATQKGVAGKSTITISVASLLAYTYRKRILVVDCDNQHSIVARRNSEIDIVSHSPTLSDYLEENNIMPYPIQSCDSYSDLAHSLQQRSALAEYDYVFVDFPGSITDPKTFDVLAQMDIIAVPFKATELDVASSKTYIEECLMRKITNSKICLFWTMVNRSYKLSQLALYKKAFEMIGWKQLYTFIPQLVCYESGIFDGILQEVIGCSSLFPMGEKHINRSNIIGFTNEVLSILQ